MSAEEIEAAVKAVVTVVALVWLAYGIRSSYRRNKQMGGES